MKKGAIIAVFILVLAFCGVGALYQFVVKERLAELEAHEQEEKKLRDRIKDLETTFERTKPEVLIEAYERSAQPWSDAVDVRTAFFMPDIEVEPVVIPEESIPRFYYRQALPEMQAALEQEARAKECVLPPRLTFGVPDPKNQDNPSKEEVEAWLTEFQEGANLVRMLIDNGARRIDEVLAWPIRKNESGVLADFHVKTIGLKIQIPMRDLVVWLDRLRTENEHYTIDALWIYKRDLRAGNDLVTVEMTLSQARYAPKKGVQLAQAGAPAGLNIDNRFEAGQAAFGDLTALGSDLGGAMGGEISMGGSGGRPDKPSLFRRFMSLFPF